MTEVLPIHPKIRKIKNKKILTVMILLIMAGIFFLFSCRSLGWQKIPVVFTSGFADPLIKCNIQGKNFLFQVDSGMSTRINMLDPWLANLNKNKLDRTNQIVDIKGNRYTCSIYSVPDVQIIPNEVLEQEIVCEDPKFLENTRLWPSEQPTSEVFHGQIGWPYFEKYSTFFDFPNSAIYVADSIQAFVVNGLSLDAYVGVPFIVERGVLFILIETDFGKQKVILDTGSSYSIADKSHVDPNRILTLTNGPNYCKMSKFLIGDCDYGKWSFCVFDLNGIDGIIGIDFFLENSVIFDFTNQMVYFERPKGILGTQWKRLKFRISQFFIRKFSNLELTEAL